MNDELVVYSEPKSKICEAIKSIRTNLQFASIDEDIKTIMVTSALSGEGKSFVAANLACAFAATEKNVLIIDCDLRRGRLHKIFETDNTRGLSNLLTDSISKSNKYIEKTKYDRVSLLSMGIVPPNPSELLSSKKNRSLIEKLKLEYDYIIFDCPPVDGLSDALVLVGMLDRVVIVSSIGITPLEMLLEAKKSLLKVDAKIAGIVVNRVPSKKGNKYYDKYYN